MSRWALVLSLWLCLARLVSAAPTLVQSAVVAGPAGQNTWPLSFASNIAANSVLVAACAVFQGTFSTTAAAFTDTRGNTWAVSTNVGVDDASSRRARLYVAVATNTGGAGADTVTCNPPGSSDYISIAIMEYSGLLTSGVLDQVSTGQLVLPGSPNVSSGTTATLSQASEVIVGAMTYDLSPNTTIDADAPCVLVQESEENGSAQSIAVCDWQVSATTGVAAAWTLGSAGGWAASVQTLKLAAATTRRGTVMVFQ